MRFAVSDVARIRFTISPLWETVASLAALAEPGRHPVHQPWLRTARVTVTEPEIARRTGTLRALIQPSGCLPDFLTPPPAGVLGDIEGELAVVAATPAARVRGELLPVRSRSGLRLAADPADPAGVLPLLIDGLRLWWRAAIEPHWARIRAVLEADIAHRTREFSIGGVQSLVDRLHPAARWAGDRLVCDDGLDTSIALAGRGLPMVPSVFASAGVLLASGEEAPPIAIYPARAVGTLWEGRPAGCHELERLLGRSRAAILAFTAAPSTTTHLAARTGLSLGAVSQHLGVLRDAGLVAGHRYRHEVHYTATDLGLALLRGGRPPAGRLSPRRSRPDRR